MLYCCAESGELVSPAKLAALRPRPTLEDAEIFLSGFSDIPSEAGSYSPIAGLCAIPPKTSWWVSPKQYRFEKDLQSFKGYPTSLDTCLRYAQRLVARANRDNLLAVDLSGGLDSSIIIDFLMQWRRPLALIGMRGDRYEFRTEREIQSYYAKHCPTVRMYSDKDIPAFSRLDEVPPHPYPTMQSLNFAHAQKKAEICQDLGVTTLLSGDAGDRLLGFPSPQWSPSGRTPENWAYWNLACTLWIDQHIFNPIGVRYISGLAVGRLPTLILQLRSGFSEDPKKLWARRKLSPYLPSMLSNYAYKAFHDGWVVDGVISALPTVRKMAKLAFAIVPHPELVPNRMEESATEFRNLEFHKRHQFLNRLTFITWVYSNHR